MKKVLAAVIAAVLLTGCASADDAVENSVSSPSAGSSASVAEVMDTTGDGQDTLIVWFSRVGNSDFSGMDVDTVTGASTNVNNGIITGNNAVLEEIAENETGADTFFIRVKDLYPGSFNETVRQFVHEEKDNTLPQLTDEVQNWDQYSKVILIYPTWDSTLPAPVRSFVKSYDWSGKTVYPVDSNDGFGAGNSVSLIQEYAPEADVKDGFAIDDDELDQAESRLKDYLEENGLIK